MNAHKNNNTNQTSRIFFMQWLFVIFRSSEYFDLIRFLLLINARLLIYGFCIPIVYSNPNNSLKW